MVVIAKNVSKPFAAWDHFIGDETFSIMTNCNYFGIDYKCHPKLTPPCFIMYISSEYMSIKAKQDKI
jgi:hypothetical protein